MGTQKLAAIWRILTAKSYQVYTQRHRGAKIQLSGDGRGDIEDLVLMAVAVKNSYNSFVGVITEAATESGELHTLESIKKAIGTLERQ